MRAKAKGTHLVTSVCGRGSPPPLSFAVVFPFEVLGSIAVFFGFQGVPQRNLENGLLT